jgi:prepilin peptidase CpaA
LLVLVVASASDIKERRIPNWTVVAIAALYLVWAAFGPVASIVSAIEAAAIVFVVTVGLFALSVVGAGDSKLMTVVALFGGLGLLPLFVLATVLFGGAIAVFSLALQPRRALAMLLTRRLGESDRGVPYGIAISMAGALVLMHQLSCASTDTRFVCF